ncbi:hypothetical protein, partial [Paracraurococcus ruber]
AVPDAARIGPAHRAACLRVAAGAMPDRDADGHRVDRAPGWPGGWALDHARAEFRRGSGLPA